MGTSPRGHHQYFSGWVAGNANIIREIRGYRSFTTGIFAGMGGTHWANMIQSRLDCAPYPYGAIPVRLEVGQTKLEIQIEDDIVDEFMERFKKTLAGVKIRNRASFSRLFLRYN
jgi:hypothetical protein